jgi:hypothetical protein
MKQLLFFTVLIFFIKTEGLTTPHHPTILFLAPVLPHQQTTTATFDIQAKIAGVSQASQIQLSVNEEPMEYFRYDAARQLLSARVDLSEGQNLIRIDGVNTAGSGSASIVIFRRAFPERSPQIRWITPADGAAETNREQVVVRAQIEALSSSGQIRLTHNDQAISVFNYNPASGLLEVSIRLYPGPNRLRLTAEQAGGYAQKTLDIYRTLPAPTQIIWQQPYQPHMITEAVQVPIRATVWPVTPDQQIRLFINGQQRFDFSFDYSSGLLQRTMLLMPGQNVIRVTVAGRQGIVERSVFVERRPPPPPPLPVVTINGLANDHTTADPLLNFQATVAGVSSPEGLLLFVNGSRQRDFRYNPQSSRLTSTLYLRDGENTIRLIGRNRGGSHQQVVRVFYQPPRLPEIAFLPPTPEGTVDTRNVTVRASINFVERARQVKWFVNGQPFTDFQYNPNRSIVRANLRLKPGKNRIRIQASNRDGQVVARRVLFWTPSGNGPRSRPGQNRQSLEKHNNLKVTERSNEKMPRQVTGK